MNHFSSRPEIFDRPVLITEGQELSVIMEFFQTFDLSGAKQHLWDWLEAALSTDNGFFNEPEDRSTLITLYQGLQELIGAALIILEKRKVSKL
jgi:hypothetical protein